MDSNRTREERTRAHDRFKAILSVHSATLEAFGVLVANPGLIASISASVRMRLGMNPKYSAEQMDRAASRVLEVVGEERDWGYATIRSSTLIAVCGAFEYLVKSTFVDQAASNPAEASALLTKARIRLAASEVLGVPPAEQRFAIADRLFEQLAEPHPRMHDRLQRYLLDYAYFPYPAEASYVSNRLGEVDAEAFNEAFLV